MEYGIKIDQCFKDENMIEAITTEVGLHIKMAMKKMEAAIMQRSVTIKIVKVMMVSLSVKMNLMSTSKDKNGGKSITVCQTAT